ncbi:MAG: MATE family efflux transporter [Treponema sp.]|nr:MATE family efflux transporter [Treponema sp.]
MNTPSNKDETIVLSPKEAHRREMILYGPQVKTICTLALPLVFYSSLSQIFQLIDTIIAARMSANVVSTVSFISQIETMLFAIGSGLSVGGSIIISRTYGAGNMQKVRSQISTLFFLALAIGMLLLTITIPFASPFLKLFHMPKDLLKKGTIYFILTIIGLIFQFINTMYLAIEKSRGNTKIIMWCNILVMSIKTLLNFLIIALKNAAVISIDTAMLMLPGSTITAHATLAAIAIINLTSKRNPFRLNIKLCSFSKTFMYPLSSLSIPIFLEKFVFAFGKVIVNSMCASMGSSVVGALGVSNRLGGLCTNPPSGFQDAESGLISQNIGNNNIKRALGIFYRTLLINLGIALVLFVITGIFKKDIVAIFAKGDIAFAAEIDKIYTYERLATILISINASVMGLLYGFGKTRISMILNAARLFVFRIPPLFLLMRFTTLGVTAVGLAMLISNCMVGITSGIVAIFFIKKYRT